ncbi:hypothetical protein CDAR_383181 [Caerostris darwini]|uniref:Uncharacterized protein n=1 Tax=Caerostris darwini TaxID=1538125 RepID=A0AAV4NVC9_9ARAC|nr:hypothetical protein CDAR_383181 [Caerostris darwini]
MFSHIVDNTYQFHITTTHWVIYIYQAIKRTLSQNFRKIPPDQKNQQSGTPFGKRGGHANKRNGNSNPPQESDFFSVSWLPFLRSSVIGDL